MKEQTGETISIKVYEVTLEGVVRIPDETEGAVLFACANHHRNPQIDFLANMLPQNSLATVRVDLLTPAEDALYEDRLDLELLTKRLARVAGWVKGQPWLEDLTLGLFGIGTSGSSALELAASLKQAIGAVVMWDARPDLAAKYLGYVTAPTLLIVGGQDNLVRQLNEKAFQQLGGEKQLVVIPGATHLFEEPGALQAVGEKAADWFSNHLALAGAGAASS
jgi:putative phosphoribosyl transferase